MRVCDTPVTRFSERDVIELVARRMAPAEPPAGPPPLALGSVNLDHLHHFRTGRTPLGDGSEVGTDWLWLADGAPVAWRGSRLAGGPWPRLTGADLLEPILGVCAAQGAQVGFLGGSPQTHARLAEVMASRFPAAAPALFWAPTRREVESRPASRELAAQIRAAGVRLLAVGLGKPRQELWIDQHGAATGAAVLLAFGAAADFLAGVVDRAPAGYRHHGLEWLYRLRQEPRRLARRYLLQGPPAFLRLRHAMLEPGQNAGLTPPPAPPGWRP